MKILIAITFLILFTFSAYSQSCPDGSQCVSQDTINKCAQAFDTVKAQKAVIEAKDGEIKALSEARESDKKTIADLELKLAVETARRQEIEKAALEAKHDHERELLRMQEQIQFLLKHGRVKVKILSF